MQGRICAGHFRQLAPVVWNQPPGTSPLWPIPVVHDVMWAAPPPPPSALSPPPTYVSLMPVQLLTAPPTAPPPLQMSSAGEDFIVMAALPLSMLQHPTAAPK